MSDQPPAPQGQPPGPPERGGGGRGAGRRLLAVGLGFLAGALLGLVGAFLVPLRVAGAPVPLSPVLAVVGNLVLGVAAARAEGTRLGSLASGCGWFAVVAVAAAPGPGGDIVLPASATAYAFLVLGALAAALPIGLGRLVTEPGPARPAEQVPRGAATGRCPV